MTQTVAGAAARREAGPVNVMWSKRRHFAAVLPDHVDVETFIGAAAGALYASEDLMKAATNDPDSLVVALMRCASLGHLPGTEEFYLTPRKKRGVGLRVLGIEGYRGVVERMFRSGAVATVLVREVCARDYFRYHEGDDERPAHRFAAREGTTGADFFGENGTSNRGPMVGVYGVAKFVTGAWSRPALLTRDDVFAARDSGGYTPDDQYSPWNRYDAGLDQPQYQGRSMWWKTAAKRLEPWVPTSAEYRREIARAAVQAAGHARPPAPATPARGRPREDDIVDAELVDDSHLDAEEGQAAQLTARVGGGPPPAEPAGPGQPGAVPAAAGLRSRDVPVTPAPVGTSDRDTPGGGTADSTSGGPAASPAQADHAQQRRISALFRQMDWTDREDRLRAASVLCGREITALSELTAAEASELTETLAGISRQPDPAIALTAAVAAARDAARKEQAGG